MSNTITRRTALVGAGALVASAAVSRRGYTQGAPIRIGYLAPLSGAQEVIGKAQLIGAQIAADQINKAGGLMGRKIELVIRDDFSKPDLGVSVVRELVGSGINLMGGGYSSPVLLAVMSILKELNAVLVSQSSSLTSLTYQNFNRNFFRPTDFNVTRNRAFARLAAEKAPEIKNIGVVISDISTSLDVWDSFRDGALEFYPALAKHSVTFEEPVRVPLNSPDFRNFISRIMRQDSSVLFAALYGGDMITMMKQQKPYGMVKKFKFILDPGNEYFIPETLKKDTPEGMWAAINWYPGLYKGHKLSDDVYAEYQARTNGHRHPQGYVGEAHSCIMAIASGIKRAQSTETDAVISAMEDMEFDTVKGIRKFRKEDHQADPDVNFVQYQPAENSDGWIVSDSYKAPGKDVLPPASPGKELELSFLKAAGYERMR